MTRMIDILEDFMTWRKYTYYRMDGSTSINDRRDMVEQYQNTDHIFAFLLSTRAGGLGINLTSADTVIFYDNDWNPTMDAQATDRVHRIGQKKEVTVYRLITRNTVEERIVKRAKQKQNVQSTVYSGNTFKADVFRPKEVVDMIFDEDEQKQMLGTQSFLKTRRVGRQKGGIANEEEGESQMDKPQSARKEKVAKIKPPKKEKAPKPEKVKKPKEVKNIFGISKQSQGSGMPLFQTSKQASSSNIFSVQHDQREFDDR